MSFDYKELLIKGKERFLLQVKKYEKRTQVFHGDIEMETKVFNGFFYCGVIYHIIVIYFIS
jgi:hypothetical protein